MQDVKLGERQLAASDPVHRGLVEGAPIAGEAIPIRGRYAVFGRKFGGEPRDAPAPIDDGAENVEYQGLHVGFGHFSLPPELRGQSRSHRIRCRYRACSAGPDDRKRRGNRSSRCPSLPARP